MKLSDLYTRLSVGEFSNLAIGSDGSGEIRPADKAKILVHINAGLLELYSRFLLVTKYLIVEMVENITNYHLISKYAETANCVSIPYIKDLPGDPFKDDLIRVLEVFDGCKCKLSLNDDNNCHSLFTPAPQMVQVPNPVAGKPLFITYQARHLPLTDPLKPNQWIELPFILEDALLSYVAYRVFSNMNGQDHMVKAQEQLALYERRVTEVEAKDLVNMSPNVNTLKLHKRGFV